MEKQTSSINPILQSKLSDITAAFKALPQSYSHSTVYEPSESGWPSVYDHIQGFARTDRVSIFTVNQTDETYGVLYIYDNETAKQIQTFEIPVKNMNHPAGAQALGDILVLGLQNQTYDKNQICFLNIRGLNDGSGAPIELLPLSVPLDGQTCASAGITDIPAAEGNGSRQFVLAVSGGGSTTIYLSSTTTTGLTDPNLSFRKIKSVLQESYQGIQLLTQQDGKVFLIVFESEDILTDDGQQEEQNWWDKLKNKTNEYLGIKKYLEGLPVSFKDFIILYEFTGKFDDSLAIQQVERLHIYTGGGDLPLVLKPHCRYGSGVTVQEQQLSCYVTGREPYLQFLDAPVVNVFTSDQ